MRTPLKWNWTWDHIFWTKVYSNLHVSIKMNIYGTLARAWHVFKGYNTGEFGTKRIKKTKLHKNSSWIVATCIRKNGFYYHLFGWNCQEENNKKIQSNLWNIHRNTIIKLWESKSLKSPLNCIVVQRFCQQK